ncbi:MAG TPA: HAD hydrolase-like protein [Ktedonobacteraceae bacterium]|nr:HAD hydrolase-like protein [Ktedonobacteraceae bacterium]
MQSQHLLVDADDTLWENNIYFEQAIHQFLAFLDHSSLQPAEIRAVLNEVEHEMGYGSANFTRSLLETYRRLAERTVSDSDLVQVRRFGETIAQHPIEVIQGVEETLTYLAPRHQLVLLTKGDEEEQKLKLENSGLTAYFTAILVVPEKDQATYHRMVQEFSLDRALTWMIGNSPRSDINPALAAGLNAVYIPHPHTWQLEMQDVLHNGEGQLLQLKYFAELPSHF